MLVQMARQNLAAAEDGDVAFHQVAAEAVSGVGAGAFEAMIVLGIGVADVDGAAHWIHYHIEKHCADAGVDGGGSGLRDGRRGGGVDGEDIFIGQRKIYCAVPNCIGFILPVHLAVGGAEAEFDNQSSWGREDALEICVRSRSGIGGNGTGGNSGGTIAGTKSGGVNGVAVGGDGECARCVGEERENGQRLAAESVAKIRCIKNPDIGAADTGSGELRIDG